MPSYIQSIIGAMGILFALHVLGRLSPDTSAASTETAHPPKVAGWCFLGEMLLLLLIGAACVYSVGAGLLHSGFIMQRWVPPAPIPHRQAMLMVALLGVTGGLFLLGTLILGVLRRSAPFIGGVMVSWALLLTLLVLGIGPLAVRSNYQQMALAGKYLHSLPDDLPVTSYFGSAPETLVYYAQRKQSILFCTLDAADFLQQLAAQMTGCRRSASSPTPMVSPPCRENITSNCCASSARIF